MWICMHFTLIKQQLKAFWVLLTIAIFNVIHVWKVSVQWSHKLFHIPSTYDYYPFWSARVNWCSMLNAHVSWFTLKLRTYTAGDKFTEQLNVSNSFFSCTMHCTDFYHNNNDSNAKGTFLTLFDSLCRTGGKKKVIRLMRLTTWEARTWAAFKSISLHVFTLKSIKLNAEQSKLFAPHSWTNRM